MQSIVYSYWGVVHVVAAVAALVMGTAVLALPKTSRLHRRLGYGYVGSLALMLGTCFGIYRQFQGFGIFHVAALLSAATLAAGMVPVLRKKPVHSWRQLHYSFLYLSVLELYVALVAEVLVRLPGWSFWEVAAASLAGVLGPGAVLFGYLRKRWQLPGAARTRQAIRPYAGQKNRAVLAPGRA